MTSTVGIVGAGILGRLSAWVLAKAGLRVTVFDRAGPGGDVRASAVAAGMLAPVCESLDAPPVVKTLGQESLRWWRAWADEIGVPDLVTWRGTIVIAPERSTDELRQFRHDLQCRGAESEMRRLDNKGLRHLESDFDERFQDGIFVPQEGHLSPSAILSALHESTLARGVEWCFDAEVKALGTGVIEGASQRRTFDWVIDARGWGAKADLQKLMPVRGEILTLSTRELSLSRPVRILHPRHAIYIVPRPDDRIVIGSSNLATSDDSSVSVRSVLEFLSVAYHVFPVLAEARLVATATGIRPAFADHRPRVIQEGRLLRINGAYRHGFLVGPMVAERVANMILGGSSTNSPDKLWDEGEPHAAQD